MSYMHISNLYKDPRILSFRRCYAMEKIHGTSAHVAWIDGELSFFSGGAKRETFVALFDHPALMEAFVRREVPNVAVFGEAYGGKMQGMKDTYGDTLRFIAFEVRIGDRWLDVPSACVFATEIGLEFVAWEEVSTDLTTLDSVRDAPSVQAVRNGMGVKPREGIVLRPPFEVRLNNDERLIAKHKNEQFAERKHVPKPGMTLETLQAAERAADEFVVPERVRHVADALGLEVCVENIGKLIQGMKKDLMREAAGEIADTPATWKCVGKRTALTVKDMLRALMVSAEQG